MSESEIKILHTSDWHLGKRLFKNDRIEEQILFLDWLVQEITENQIDILIIAGDIFDVPSPPMRALQALYDFIYKLGELDSVETFLITGNHDSSTLLEIPKSFFNLKKCHVYSKISSSLEAMNYVYKKGNITLGLKHLPYFRNFELTNLIEQNNLLTDEQNIKKYFDTYFSHWDHDQLDHKILISHHGFGKYSAAGSEHAIYLSGLEYFPLEWVQEHFDYIALGHIHKKQLLSKSPPILYTGSPIALRFSETSKKIISKITVTKNSLNFEEVQVPVFRKLLTLRSCSQNYENDLNKLIKDYQPAVLPAFLEISIQMQEASSGIADKIRDILKGSEIELISYIPVFNQADDQNITQDQIAKLSLEDLFKSYYQVKFSTEEIPKEVEVSFKQLLEETRNENS